jgi:nucleoside-diphosphate-sugar epimerase
VFVADVVHFLVRMLEQNQKWRTVNLGSGVSTSILDLVHTLSSVVGKDLETTTIGVDKDERWGFRADLTNLKSAFKEVPKTSLKEGLEKTWRASH